MEYWNRKLCASTKATQIEKQNGSILVLALIFSVVVAMAIGAATTTAFQNAKASRHSIDQVSALSLAEGVTETAQKRMLDDVANFQQPSLAGTVSMNGVNYPFTAVAAGPPINRLDDDGVTLAIQPYQITASVEDGEGAATVTRIVDLTMTPIFQYMIFYGNDCEILPGPSMTLGGRVHANGNIYVGCGSTLSVDTDYFRCTGEIYRERKNDGRDTGGTIDIRVQGSTDYENMSVSMDSNNADFTTMALDTWEGTVQTGSHGVTEVSVPTIGTIKPYEEDGTTKAYYHENAELVIRDGIAYDSDDNVLTLPAGVITETTMYDAREGKTVTLTEIDISLLNGSGYFPANGLIYAYRTDSDSSQPNGIRVVNGSEVAGPMNLVSQNPVYLQGDFNTVNKKGAAIMCDALNFLSNDWDNSKAPGSGIPRAAATQYNVAIVTGDIPTPDGGGNYSGGFENLPRFHENWGGINCTIRGSFVKIFESEIGQARWGSSNVYSPPIRDWAFDPDLLTPNQMPPFTPQAVYFRRVVWDDNVPNPF